MSGRRRTGEILLAAILAAPLAAPADDGGPADAERIAQLSHRLGAADFSRREQAEAELLSLGPSALPTLRRMLPDADLEARHRLTRIIETLEVSRRAQALTTFRNGKLPDDPRLVAAWNACERLTGDDQAARDLFAEMVRDEPWLVNALTGSREDLRMSFERRCADVFVQQLQRQQAQRSVATVAALLLAARQPDCYPSPLASNCLLKCIREGTFVEVMERPNRPAPLERLVGVWLADAQSSNPQDRLQMAVKFDLVEAVEVARQIVAQRAPGPQLSYAVMYLAKTGNPSYLHDLELLLDDVTDLQARRQNTGAQGSTTTFSSRVQDVALVGLLHLTGQDPRSYGFTGLRPHDSTIYAATTVGFESQEQRSAALAQWKRWSAAHLKAVQPLVEQAALGYSA